jgi:hypothetical protein
MHRLSSTTLRAVALGKWMSTGSCSQEAKSWAVALMALGAPHGSASVMRSMPLVLRLLPLPALENRRDPLATTHTHGLQPVACITPLHFVQ